MKLKIALTGGLIALVLFWGAWNAMAETTSGRPGVIKTGVEAEGACAIVGMSAEQCQLTALQRARAAVIEQAVGVSITSATLVTNYTLAADFIQTYARGFIVAEKVTWLPLGQYQRDSAAAPIPEYHVRIVADVYVPQAKTRTLGLQASLNNTFYRAGEHAFVSVEAMKDARVAIFNIMANDTAALLFPNPYEKDNRLTARKPLVFPEPSARVELTVHTLQGHAKDAEAFLVLAWEEAADIDIVERFAPGRAIPLHTFFESLTHIIDRCEEILLPYEVVAK